MAVSQGNVKEIWDMATNVQIIAVETSYEASWQRILSSARRRQRSRYWKDGDESQSEMAKKIMPWGWGVETACSWTVQLCSSSADKRRQRDRKRKKPTTTRVIEA